MKLQTQEMTPKEALTLAYQERKKTYEGMPKSQTRLKQYYAGYADSLKYALWELRNQR